MKFTLALLAVANVNAACECLGTEENGLPPSTFFTDRAYPAAYGASCSPWDLEDPTCQEGEANYGVDWCTESWCYVAADNDCDPAALDTVFFADTEYAETLKFAVSACAVAADAAATDADAAATETEATDTEADAAATDASVTLYASAVVVISAVAASI